VTPRRSPTYTAAMERSYVVTGGASGVGRAIAERLATVTWSCSTVIP
jgi:NAD(P)-dependent dehydrogenase (short-subunit alcohol dehydrogenase family)